MFTLQRIADFILPGPGVWYEVNENGIMFYDGKHDPEFRDTLQITYFWYMHKVMAIPYVAANLLN